MFQVGEVSRRLGLNPQTLYFYERIRLIPSPQRTVAGYRLYSQEDIERIAFITRAKSLGLSLDEIKDILVLKDGGELTCQAVYDRLSQKIQDIQENIQKLQTLHDELLPLLEQCHQNFDHPDPTHQCIVLEKD
ncbi:heavy metal-responsive transcriptional regulator [Planktothrix mougeotii]|uniref:Heavy metal-responsive transcriptional regulator n=1 Tax=Planktothrix mougeotii LEGE 06226 TaxID=1828728 RepID=A0ABR9U9F1_9CYAN|nr:heavy metal-responsive transcriptional regulator [Planktothrix mougeotii]MBE9143080.1 heavy metal-responsive transcriptional regulator [Planktothrix mougeotii LEGE 06226]